jgi:hypothetical protein
MTKTPSARATNKRRRSWWVPTLDGCRADLVWVEPAEALMWPSCLRGLRQLPGHAPSVVAAVSAQQRVGLRRDAVPAGHAVVLELWGRSARRPFEPVRRRPCGGARPGPREPPRARLTQPAPRQREGPALWAPQRRAMARRLAGPGTSQLPPLRDVPWATLLSVRLAPRRARRCRLRPAPLGRQRYRSAHGHRRTSNSARVVPGPGALISAALALAYARSRRSGSPHSTGGMPCGWAVLGVSTIVTPGSSWTGQTPSAPPSEWRPTGAGAPGDSGWCKTTTLAWL